MLEIRIDPAETRRALEKLRATAETIEGGLEEMLLREGASMEADIKVSLNVGGRTNGRGPRGGKIVTHSAPGEPPRKQSGVLQNAMGYLAAINKKTGDFILDIGAIRGGKNEVAYAQELELGRSDMAPRPYLYPVVKKHFQKWEKNLREIVKAIS